MTGFLLFALAGRLCAAEAGGRVWKTLAQWYGEEINPHAPGVPAGVEQSELRFREGDDPRWASPEWDDSAWQVEGRENCLPKNRGIFWIRLRVRATGAGNGLPGGIFLGGTASQQVFWDGVLVHAGGIPGSSRAAEKPGPVYALFELPPGASRAPGEHVIALRLSTYHFNRPDRAMSLYLCNVAPSELATAMERQALVPLMGVGAMFVIALAGAGFWLTAGRRLGLFLFSSVAAGGAATEFLLNVRQLFPVPYSWSYGLWLGTEAIVALTVVALVALVLAQFELKHRRWVLAGLVAALAAVTILRMAQAHAILSMKSMADCWRIGLLCAVALVGRAAYRRKRGAWAALAGLVFTALVFLCASHDVVWFDYPWAILPTLLGFMMAIGLAIREERRQAREAKLTAARLELELLRKSLQPHFLMNTLTALAQAIEENPPRAVRLIDDLADELRTLARFAQEKLVGFEQEMELCRTHLRVMSARTERTWQLEVSGAPPGAAVPPALFFTLIENGFTHQEPSGGVNTFRLRGRALAGGGVRYEFFSPGTPRPSGDRARGGSGLRYVKARLEESWSGAWIFGQEEAPGGWATTIELGVNGGPAS